MAKRAKPQRKIGHLRRPRLKQFAERPLEEDYPYVLLDARYERVREGGVVRQRAVQIAIGINQEGRRRILGVGLAGRESTTSWKDFLIGLKGRGLRGVQLAISDHHEGLRQSIREVLPEAVWQRCYVHFLRNAIDHLTRKADRECLTELRWLYERRDVEEARRDLAAWLQKWQSRQPKLCDWAEQRRLPQHAAARGGAPPSPPAGGGVAKPSNA